MIDFMTYDPARDADESVNHFCNSLNATLGAIHHTKIYDSKFCIVDAKLWERIGDYIERAQATINYLREIKQEAVGGTVKND